jgi:hypothetical protein
MPELSETQGTDRLFLYTDQGIPSDFIRELESYLAKYGDRSFEELKLESETFRDNPAQLLRLIAGYARVENMASDTSLRNHPKAKTGSNDSISETQDSTLPILGWKGRFARHWAQRAIEARESSRLRRGRFYGWFRVVDVFADFEFPAFAGSYGCKGCKSLQWDTAAVNPVVYCPVGQ